MLAIVLSAQTTATPTPTPTPTNTGPGDVIPLPLPTPEILASIEMDINIDRMQLFTSGSWPGFGTVGLAVPTAFREWPPIPYRLNHIYWPNGSTRWGTAMVLCHKDQADAIHDWCFGSDGSERQLVTLVLTSDLPDDTEADRVELELMTVYPPIPLYLVLNDDSTSDNGMYILLLTDDRKTWWDIPTPDFAITESAGKTWANVFDAIKTALGLDSLDVDTIDAKYLQPSRALNLSNEPIPLVLDSLCANVGHRLVVSYSGEVFTQNFKTALTALDRDIQDHEQERGLIAGGDLYADSY